MANEVRLIDANALGIGKAKREVFNNPAYADGWNSAIAIIENAPTVDAYTEEQVASIIHRVDELEARNRELEKDSVWLKSCLNCKIRKKCPRHCGKVVHDCDHWEYGDSAVDAVEVVRCKDCKNDGECSIQDAMNWTPRTEIGDYFCSYGERKDND